MLMRHVFSHGILAYLCELASEPIQADLWYYWLTQWVFL